jgi:hypothetical protein
MLGISEAVRSPEVGHDAAPDTSILRAHLAWMFGDCRAFEDGQIEVAWRDARTGKLSACQYFALADIDSAIKCAVAANETRGQNIYFGATVKDPNTALCDRSSDSDAYAAPAIWIDCDHDGDLERVRAIYNKLGCPPNAVVVTARVPHTRFQCWWKLTEPLTDMERLRRVLKAAQTTFGSDAAVTNPGRLMRLAGSIAWPVKDGRVQEQTQWHAYPDRPVYPIERLERAFGCTDLSLVERDTHGPAVAPRVDDARGAISGTLSADTLIQRIRSGQEWHNNMIRLVAHQIGRGMSDAEILAMAAGFTLPGYTVEQTEREMRAAIEGARRKWNRPNVEIEFDPETGEIKEPGAPISIPFAAEPFDVKTLQETPTREWILGSRYIAKFVTLTIAPGGVGKSTLTMQEAVAVALKNDEIVGATVHRQGNVWIYNAEDPIDELYRRLRGIVQGFKLDPQALVGKLFVNSGRQRRLIVAKRIDGAVVMTPDIDACIAEIQKNKISLWVVDPFVRVHSISENANEEIDAVMDAFGKICDATGCAISLVHHARKISPLDAEAAGNPDIARGASSLVAASRMTYTLTGMTGAEAARLNIPEDGRRWFVRLDDAKTNMSAPSENVTWFKKRSVPIGNGKRVGDGDEVGVLDFVKNILAHGEDPGKRTREKIVEAMLEMKVKEISINGMADALAKSKALGIGKTQLNEKIPEHVNPKPTEETDMQKVVVGDMTYRIYRSDETGHGRTNLIYLVG